MVQPVKLSPSEWKIKWSDFNFKTRLSRLDIWDLTLCLTFHMFFHLVRVRVYWFVLCKEIVGHLKSTTCPQDVIPPLFLRQIIVTVGPGLLLVINNCLLAPSYNCLKYAVVSPYLKIKYKKTWNFLCLFQSCTVSITILFGCKFYP